MNIYLGENDDEIGLMSLLDDLIVLHNGKRYTIDGYINKLQKENKQLKLDYELYKDNYVHRNYEVEIRDNTIKQLKEIIEEVREDIVFCINGMKNEFACTDSRTNRELHTMVKILEDRLQILDKIKDVK